MAPLHVEPPRGHPDDHIVPPRGWIAPPPPHHEEDPYRPKWHDRNRSETHTPIAPPQHDDDPYRPKWHDRAEQPNRRNRRDGRSETHSLLPAPAPIGASIPSLAATTPHTPTAAPPQHEEDPYRPKWHDRTEQPTPHHRHGLHMPESRKTRPHTWFLAMFCTIFWVLVILGGLVVLTVYLVFRPRLPRFEVSAASLNAAYLDMGYLLNADMMLLANFTNPNRKMGVEFVYMYVELRYGRTLIATQYLDPFSAPKGSTRFANVHMVTSQVRLSELEVQRMKRQMVNNRVMFEVKGFFRAKSRFGGLLRYSYWLHSRCTIVMTRPPDGVLVARRCQAKH